MSTVVHGEVTVIYLRGLPVITVPLPSRRERCCFTLRPISNTVGDFITEIQSEDRGIDRISVRTTDGVRIASSTSIESLMQNDFQLIVNDVVYHVHPPAAEKISLEELQRLSNVRNLVNTLYEALNVEEHQLTKERELFSKLESLKVELEPLEKKRVELEAISERRTTLLSWCGLGFMATQFGILARLTWWEYSWDIMEPVTYFVTYGTTMAAFGYYVLTKQEYILADVKDRQFLVTFHKRAKKIGLDVHRYNEVKDSIAQLEHDLRRLRDPLFIHLPRGGLLNVPNSQQQQSEIGSST